MGLFGKNKKKQTNAEEPVLQQDHNKEDFATRPGGIFIVHLLMNKPCKMPEPEKILSVMKKHVGKVEWCTDDKEEISTAAKYYPISIVAKDHPVEYVDGTIAPPFFQIAECMEFDEKRVIDDLSRTQFWNHKEDYEQILSRCHYNVMATDFMAGELPAQKRADLDMDYMEALVELFPECEAVYFRNSGNLYLAEEIRTHQIPRENRYVHFAVNVRFFNVQGKEDKVIDTLGMSLLKLPDLQYHFRPQPSEDDTRQMDPNWVVHHAYNMATYILKNSPSVNERFIIKNGETIDGIREGQLAPDIFWRCQYEDALIQPRRLVLDICMNEYAAGER